MTDGRPSPAHPTTEAILDRLPRTAWLAVDLDRIVANVAALRAAVPPGVSVEPVVKADAYGHGAVPVAHALAAAGVGGLCVATMDEAMQLREAGLDAPVLVLYPIPPRFAPDAARRGVRVSVGDETLLDRMLQAMAATSEPGHERLRIELEVETGLGRGGVAVERVPHAAAAIRAHPLADLVALWSHLGEADDTTRTTGQVTSLETASRLAGATGSMRRHLAASGGVLAASVPAYEAVRPGLATYGIVPEGLRLHPDRIPTAAALRPAMSLHARPVRVIQLAAGTGVSYGSAFVTARPSRIATLPVGYADGYPRALTGRAMALVRGLRVPVVGTVAMDAIMVDVTDVPGPPVTVDDEFVLIGTQLGEEIRAIDVARAVTTISYEVLAGMARRLPRVYYAAGSPIGLRTLTEERGPWRTATRDPASRNTTP